MLHKLLFLQTEVFENRIGFWKKIEYSKQ